MKKTISYLTVLFCILVLLLSCSKNAKDNFSRSTPVLPDRIINAKVAPGQTYTLNVANTGEVSISRQATHYLVSETGIDEKNGFIIYKYIPASGFTGADEVLLSQRTEIFTSSNNGCNYGGDIKSSHSSSIAIKFNVAN